ncbi:two pore channel protein 1-like [Dreissena polymorpha]|uniref:EF-hand domain-containing protein n=1 Tax=Dreissena polymorpha TaxID=45954 RepID=A0A9D4LKN0_DREPO|nr:two pore channel protein 1-like [Dreissena polymorpha]KAH3859383.1 hypothetical protein DPMN_102103 [Dreissena polymorpha]
MDTEQITVQVIKETPTYEGDSENTNGRNGITPCGAALPVNTGIVEKSENTDVYHPHDCRKADDVTFVNGGYSEAVTGDSDQPGVDIKSSGCSNRHKTDWHGLTSVDGSGKSAYDDLPTYLPVRSRRGLEFGSEKQITDDDLNLAATLVADAMEGHKFEVKREPRYVRSYKYFKSMYMRLPLYVAIISSLLLALFEKPAVKGLELPYQATMAIEGACLLFFVFRICHHAHWRSRSGFEKDIKMLVAIASIIVTVVDMVVYVFLLHLTSWQAVRYTRSLRPLLIMNFSDGTHLSRAWSNIRITLRQIAHVIGLFYFLILVFALVGMKLFQTRTDISFPDGTPYFKNYIESFWQLYILVTTANNPDVMVPAYDKNRLYCLYFTLYIIICLYLMLNILLAVTYSSYRDCMKNNIRRTARIKKNILHQAFEVIKINVDGKEMVTYKTWTRLIRLAHPRKTKHQIDLLMMVLDEDKSGFISRSQFLNIADLLNVPISVVSERKTFLEIHFPRFYLSPASRLIRRLVSSLYFSLAYDAIVVANVAVICANYEKADWLFAVLYIVEIVLKWFTYGTRRYFMNTQNWFDVIITLISVVVLIIVDSEQTGKVTPEILSVLNVFRIFRILRCLREFERFRIIFGAVFNVSFLIITYCGILFIVFYCFAIIGIEVFSGKIEFLEYNQSSPTFKQKTCNNAALNGSMYSTSRYCGINFNDIVSAHVLLASLLVVNNWHVICDGYVLVTSKVARIYFMSFHLCVTIVVMNIVTAFILDMFMYEYTFAKKGNIDTKVEQTIKNLQLGIDDETGMEIKKESKPSHTQKEENPSMFHTKSMLKRLQMKSTIHLSRPNLSRYDGIRFHIKRRGWMKTELLLEQLLEQEEENAVNEHDHEEL